jgi:C1A family cysteine protease
MLLKKLISVFTVLVFLTTLFPAVMLFARDIKPVPEGLMEAPLNPAFIEFIKNPPEVNYGYIPPPFDTSHLNNIVPKNYAQPKALPTQYDWREQNGVTPIKDQNPCGTCWIFGTTSVLESKALINEGVSYDFSEQSVALSSDRSWVYLYDDSDDPCMAGGWSWLAAETFIRKGAKLESCSPYTPSTLSCDGSCLEDSCPGIKRVNGYRLVTNDGSQLDLIKQAIYSNGPVTGAFYYSSTYLYYDPTFGYFYDCPTTSSTNHLISIVGWDDSIPHMNTQGTGAWIVKNSWGASWANSGYFYLAYKSSNLEEISYLLYEDYNTSQTLYSWDESTMNSSLGYGDNDAWMASVYTSQIVGQLKQVEFWVPSPNAIYQLYIYDGNSGSNLLAQKSGTLQEMGYYSIPLSTPVNLSQGQAFTVMVKLNTPGYKYPIPIEYVDSFAQPPIQSGVTFIRNNDGDEWWDTSNNGWNVCLRAVVEITPPAIHLTQPNGGEVLTGGSSYSVQWTISGDLTKINRISVDYTTDNGAKWYYIFSVSSGFSTSMSKSWTVPNVSSTLCKLRVGLVRTDNTISVDYSDSVFTIQVGLPIIHLTQPNGGEVLTGGSSYSVQWTISGDLTKINRISVDYTTDNGAKWYYIFSVSSGFSTSMSKSWTVPNVSSTLCKLRVGLVRTDNTISVDYSDSVFTIQITP